MTFPLIHIGYHKTGTSWLQGCLFNNICSSFVSPFARDKEIGNYLIYPNALDFSPQICKKYFYPKLLETTTGGLIPVLSYERLSGNPHSGGYDSKEIANRLAQVFPDAKILIVIREQKDIILSTYKQYVIEGGACTIKRYLHPPSRGKGRIPLFSFDHFKYDRLIKCYSELFSPSNVLVLPYELFREMPHKFLSAIATFCGTIMGDEMPESLPVSTRKNIGFSAFAIAIKRRVNPIFAEDRLNPWALFPSPHIERQLEWWLRRYSGVIPPQFCNIFDDGLKKKICDIVGDRYKLSNRLIAEMINMKKMAEYGYDL